MSLRVTDTHGETSSQLLIFSSSKPLLSSRPITTHFPENITRSLCRTRCRVISGLVVDITDGEQVVVVEQVVVAQLPEHKVLVPAGVVEELKSRRMALS